MHAQRSELSDRGGSHGPSRRSSSIFVTSVGAFFALFLAPLAVVAITNAVPPASGDVSVLFVAIFAIASLLLAGFGVLGAIIARSAGSVGVVAYGWIVAGVLFASAACYGIAAVLHSIA